MKTKKEEIEFPKLVSNNENYMDAFRYNVGVLRNYYGWSVRVLAEKSNLSVDTLNNFLKGTSKDCNLVTAIRLADAFNISIDELVGAGTLSENSRNSLDLCRRLSERDLYLVRWYIKYMKSLAKKDEGHGKGVSVMKISCNHNGNLKITTDYVRVDVSGLSEEYRYKVFFGIAMPCEHYMPTYSPFDILLIANDREPISENSLIRINGNLCIAKRKIEDGIVKYYSVRDGKYRFGEEEVDEHIGYIAKVIRHDGNFNNITYN